MDRRFTAPLWLVTSAAVGGVAVLFVMDARGSALLAMLALSVLTGVLLRHAVADFVAGIILRRDQSIRMGEWVSVHGIAGRVDRIGWRHTTLTGDNPAVVPNSTLIAGRVSKFTGERPRRRLRLTVTVRRDGDPDCIRELLIQSACEHALLQTSPEPEVIFDRIEAHALRFELTAWTDRPRASLTRLQSELSTIIGRKFAASGIDAVVAFEAALDRTTTGGFSNGVNSTRRRTEPD